MTRMSRPKFGSRRNARTAYRRSSRGTKTRMYRRGRNEKNKVSAAMNENPTNAIPRLTAALLVSPSATANDEHPARKRCGIDPRSAMSGLRIPGGQLLIAPRSSGKRGACEWSTAAPVPNARKPKSSHSAWFRFRRAGQLASQYRRRDSNPHEVYPHWILNPARLPFRHSGLIGPPS